MDYRKALAVGNVLEFPGMPCTLEAEIGRGSNAIVYKGHYPDRMNREQCHTVLIKELFPLHPKGAIYRNELGGISFTAEGEETFALHTKSFEYGNQIHLRMLGKYPESIGGNLNTFSLGGTVYTLLSYIGGRSLESTGRTPNLRLLTIRMLRLLDSLEAFHESGFLHLDIAPDNILLIGHGRREQVMLIDYNSVYEQNVLAGPAYSSVKVGYSAPEIITGGAPSVASDLYSVTAVFFCCLTGATLTPFQMSRPKPPDVSDCPALQDQPDTVAAMVARILRKGLQSLPRQRWQSVLEMRRDIEELLNRIDGMGITHWALWEGGRKMIDRAIRENPFLAFIRQSEEFFPANARTEDGEKFSVNEYLNVLASRPQQVAQMIAPGGMGKTTSLLRGVLEQSQSYSPTRPAVFYLSLYGWKEGETSYIHDRILENLHFWPEQKSFFDARYTLDQLMQTPLQTPKGEKPVLLLLLDGLNEAGGTAQTLLEEIAALSRMPGVSLLVSGRNAESGLTFPSLVLEPLDEKDVTAGLARYGLLPPESEEARRLLQTPLMLSIFIRSAHEEGCQLFVNSKEELLAAYLSALYKKEVRDLPVDSDRRWQVAAAIYYVLPCLAAELQRKWRELSDRELMTAVERCYRLFSTRLLRRAFPQWIGRSKAIRGEAANADEWYGQIVHELLWKRLGLLNRDEQGRYQVSHQIIREYLCTLDAENQERIWRQRRKRIYLVAALCFALLLFGWTIYDRQLRPRPYDEICANYVFVYGVQSYIYAGRQYEAIRELLNCAMTEPAEYPRELSVYQNREEQEQPVVDRYEDYAMEWLEKMLPTGSVMPWSEEKLETAYYENLVGLAGSRRKEYALLSDILTWVVEDPWGEEQYQRKYISQLSSLIETDASITARLYQIVCLPHMTGKYAEDADTMGARNIRQMVASVPYQGIHMDFRVADPAMQKSDLNSLCAKREAIINEIRISGVLSAYEEFTKNPAKL